LRKTVPPQSVKAARSAVTREAILASCLRLFAKRGFVSTSIDMIATSAGITKGAVYWHFDNKDALFAAILGLIQGRWQDAVLKPVSAEKPATARLQQLFAGYSQLFTDHPEICLFMQRVLLEGDETYSPRVARVFEQTVHFIATILDDGKQRGEFRVDFDSARVAHSIIAGIAGGTQQHLVNPALPLARLLDETKTMTLARVSR
jgi:AcrR family transcriptional regulator